MPEVVTESASQLSYHCTCTKRQTVVINCGSNTEVKKASFKLLRLSEKLETSAPGKYRYSCTSSFLSSLISVLCLWLATRHLSNVWQLRWFAADSGEIGWSKGQGKSCRGREQRKSPETEERVKDAALPCACWRALSSSAPLQTHP